jgi:hypothetical protein
MLASDGHLRPLGRRRAVLEQPLELLAEFRRIGVLVHGNGVLHGGFQQFGIVVGADGDRYNGGPWRCS